MIQIKEVANRKDFIDLFLIAVDEPYKNKGLNASIFGKFAKTLRKMVLDPLNRHANLRTTQFYKIFGVILNPT